MNEVTNDSIAGMVEESSFQLEDYSLDTSGAKFCTVGKDVAILAYPVHERRMAAGKTSTTDAFDLSVWVRRNGSWVCAAHSETIAGKAA